MGYTTQFEGRFELDRPLTVEHLRVLEDLGREVYHGEVGMPDSYCQWTPTRDGKAIEWDGCEKFYFYVEWLEFVIERFLAPWGYVVNGSVEWQGEEVGDVGVIRVADNAVAAGKYLVLAGKVKCPECGCRFDPEGEG